MNFEQIQLTREELSLLKTLAKSSIVFTRDDSRLHIASNLADLNLICYYGPGSTPATINDYGRRYLSWSQKRLLVAIVKVMAWMLTTAIALIASVYSYLEYNRRDDATHGYELEPNSHIIQNVDPGSFVPDFVDPSSELTP